MNELDRYESDSQITAASSEALDALRDAVAIREEASLAKAWVVTRPASEKHFSAELTRENSDGEWDSITLKVDIS